MKDPLFFGFALSMFSLLLLLINAILFLTRFKKHNKLYKNVTIYLVILFLVEVFCNTIGFLRPGENSFLSHFYFNSQFLLLSIFFYNLFNISVLKKVIMIIYIVITLIIIGGYLFTPSSFWHFNLFEILTTSSFLIIYVLIHLYMTLNKEKNYFYFSLGLILYLICSCLIFMSGNYELVFIEEPYIDIWIFNTIFYILYQMLIGREWFYIRKDKKNDRRNIT